MTRGLCSVDFIYGSNFWSTYRKYAKSFELVNKTCDLTSASSFWCSRQKTIFASCERFVFISDAEQILCCFRNKSPLSPCDAETLSSTVSFGDTNNAVGQVTQFVDPLSRLVNGNLIECSISFLNSKIASHKLLIYFRSTLHNILGLTEHSWSDHMC